MPRFDTTAPAAQSERGEWTPLETGEYLMEIAHFEIAPSKFPNDKGEHEEEVTIRWSLAEWNEDLAAQGYQEGQSVFQHMRPFYGETQRGPSKFKQLVDPLIAEGLIPAQFDGPEMVGVRRHVLVEKYRKSMGPNAGEWGNRVLSIAHHKGSGTKYNGRPAESNYIGRTTIERPQPTAAQLTSRIAGPPPALKGDNDADITDSERAALLSEYDSYAREASTMEGGEFWSKKRVSALDNDQLRDQIGRVERWIERHNPKQDEELFAEA